MRPKEAILKFLKENGGEYSISELSRKTKISYPTTLKWVEVLASEKKIVVKEYRSIRLVSFRD